MRLWSRNFNTGPVVFVRLGNERATYRVLRDKCGFTHYGVRTVAYRHLHTPRWVRAIGKERKEFVEYNTPVIEALAVQCMSSDPLQVGRKVLNLVWNDRSEPPAVCWTIVAEVALFVCRAMEFSSKDKRRLWSRIRILREYESINALKQWTDSHVESYLIIKGLLSPRSL